MSSPKWLLLIKVWAIGRSRETTPLTSILILGFPLLQWILLLSHSFMQLKTLVICSGGFELKSAFLNARAWLDRQMVLIQHFVHPYKDLTQFRGWVKDYMRCAWGLISDVPARLGLKAAALAWPDMALASSNLRPGRGQWLWPGSSLAWPRPRPGYMFN